MGVVKARVVIPDSELDETFSIEGDVLGSLDGLAQEVEGFLVSQGLGEGDFVGSVVFSQFDEVLESYSLGKRKLNVGSVAAAAVRMLQNEIILELNTELFLAGKPLIVFPAAGSDRDSFSSLRLSVADSVEHVKLFHDLALDTDSGSVWPLVGEYVSRYEVLPYSVVVLWGFAVRNLLRENRKILGLTDEVYAGVWAFADVAANMVQNKVWMSGHAGSFSPTSSIVDEVALVEALKIESLADDGELIQLGVL